MIVVCSQDVTPYMNPCPYTVSPHTRMSQVFNLFRTMGLRHLPVVNAEGEVRRGRAELWKHEALKKCCNGFTRDSHCHNGVTTAL